MPLTAPRDALRANNVRRPDEQAALGHATINPLGHGEIPLERARGVLGPLRVVHVPADRGRGDRGETALGGPVLLVAAR